MTNPQPPPGEELRALAERATAGPWSIDQGTVIISTAPWPLYDGPYWHDWDNKDREPVGRFVAETRTKEAEGEANAAYIAAANPAAILSLLDERDALRKAVEAYQRIHKSVDADLHSAHQGRGNGASQWMREDDTELRRDFTAAGALAVAALKAPAQ